jgi:hypothetical protein
LGKEYGTLKKDLNLNKPIFGVVVSTISLYSGSVGSVTRYEVLTRNLEGGFFQNLK